MIEIGINSEILAQILDGRKTIEGRLAKGKFLALQPGDLISIREDIYKDGTIVESRPSAAMIKVASTQKFDNFRNMLSVAGYQRFIPDVNSIEEAHDEYKKYYSPKDEAEYGVLAISFEVLCREGIELLNDD